MSTLSLFQVYRLLLVIFVTIYAGSWLVAVAFEGLHRRRGAAEAHTVGGGLRRLQAAYGPRLRRDVGELAALAAVLVFLIVLHGWRGPWT